MCLCSATPSQKYGMRGGRGEVVSSYGAVQGPRWTGKGQSAVRVEVLEGGDNSLICSYKYMSQRLRDVRDGEAMFLFFSKCALSCWMWILPQLL